MEHVVRTDRKLVRNCHVFDLYEDTMQLPDGNTAYWDFLKHNGAAAVVPVTEDGKILLVRQFRNAVDRMSLEIPAGKKDTPDEDPYECAKRELEEEAGYRSENLEHLLSTVTAIAYDDETIEIYVARDLEKTAQHLDDDEFIDVEAFTLEELLKKIYAFEIQDAKTVAAILAYANRFGNKGGDLK